LEDAMSDFVTLSCPTCGGKLQITQDIDRFACSHCGNEHVVKRSGGIVALSPVVEGLAKVQVGVDKAASELTIIRLNSELMTLKQQEKEIAAKLGRARKDVANDPISSVIFMLTILFVMLSFFFSSGASRPVLIVLALMCGINAVLRLVTLRKSITQIKTELAAVDAAIAEKHRMLQESQQLLSPRR
jgi:predicted RNA-binding Zn-ribbon protein involved in translation (DUF1610 family)